MRIVNTLTRSRGNRLPQYCDIIPWAEYFIMLHNKVGSFR